MNVVRIFLIAAALAVTTPGCTKKDARHATDPVPRNDPVPATDPSLTEIREARWISGQEELSLAAARAARSPLTQRAVGDLAADPRLSFHRGGVVGAVGVARDGSPVRFTILPYQNREDIDHAVYFALVEGNDNAYVESFELIRNQRPGPDEVGYERVNSGEHSLWMKSGPTYLAAGSGIVRRAPERFKWAKFGTCFIPLADRGLGMVRDGCHRMGDFPGCVTYGSIAVIAGAALYCAYMASQG